MDKHTRDNWRKVKKALEAAGKTDCWYYRRAIAIERTGKDPLEHPVFKPDNDNS